MTRHAITLVSLAVTITLGACGVSQQKVNELEAHTVCTLDGNAYFSRYGGGSIFYLTRVPELDAVCALPK